MKTAALASLAPEDLVEALYEAFLGRPADRPGLEAHAAAVRADGIVSTLRAFIHSAEFAECLGVSLRPSIALIGNCNASALARCLRTSPKLFTRWVADINFATAPTFRIALAAMMAGDADTVVSVRFGGDHPSVETEMLRRTCRATFRTVTNVFLSGLHPDITFLGSSGRRLQSPTTDYHSKIVLMAYLRGESPAACVDLFNQDVYHRLGYFDEFERSAAELRRRDEDMDIRFADRLIEMTRHEHTLLTNNHPASVTLAELAGTIARHCGVDVAFAPDSFENELLDHPIWPIYPEIGEALRLPYGTEFAFRAGQRQAPLSLAEYVAGSFAMYDLQGRDELAAAAAQAKLDPDIL